MLGFSLYELHYDARFHEYETQDKFELLWSLVISASSWLMIQFH
jgi:hypothetical protein